MFVYTKIVNKNFKLLKANVFNFFQVLVTLRDLQLLIKSSSICYFCLY